MTRTRPYRQFLIALLAVLALTPRAARAGDAPANGGKYALLIGVRKCKGLRELPFAERDVEGLAAALGKCGFKEKNIWQMTFTAAKDDPRWLPTRENILDVLRDFLKELKPEDTVLLAFAGHGVQFAGDDESYFCPFNGDLSRNKRHTLLPYRAVIDELNKCPARNKVALIDACRNDPREDLTRGPALVRLPSVRFQSQAQPENLAILFSCQAGEEAFEDPKRQHGVFFRYVIEYLNGNAAPEGDITFDGLAHYVSTSVYEDTKKAGHPQHPNLVGDLNISSSIVLAHRGPAKPRPRLTNATPVCCLPGHDQVVSSVAFFPDGTWAASGSYDGTVRIWNLANRSELACLDARGAGWVLSVAVAPDGGTILAGYADRTIRLWDKTTEKVVRVFRGHTDWPRSVAFSPDGRFAASGGEDGLVYLWNIDDGKPLKCFKGHRGRVNRVAFDKDFICSGGADGTVRLWDVISRELYRALKGAAAPVYGVALAHNRVAACCEDGTVLVWDLESGSAEPRRFHVETGPLLSVALAPDGRRLLCGAADRTLRMWDLTTGKASILHGHEAAVQCVTFSPNGKQALSCSGGPGEDDNSVRLWQLPD
jgi:WD40 repeat protein